MVTKAELETALKEAANLTKQYFAAYVATSKRQGFAPLTPNQAVNDMSRLMQGGIAGTVTSVQFRFPWMKSPGNINVNQTGRAFSKWWKQSQATADIYDALHPQGFNWLGILPLVIIGGAEALLATGTIGAAAGAAGAGAAAAPTIAPISTAAVSSVATAAGASAASELASAASGATSAITTAGSIASDVGGALSKLTGGSTVGSIASSLISGAGSLVTDISKYISPLIDFGKSVLSDIETIDKTYVEPFINAFTREYDTVVGAIGTIHTLAHEGLQGILAIPQAIGGAVQGLANGVLAAADATNTAQADLVKGTLAPAITTGVGEPIAQLTSILGTANKAGFSTVGITGNVNIEENPIKNNLQTVLSAKSLALRGEGGWVNDFAAAFYDILETIVSFAGAFEGLLEASRYEGNNNVRPAPLDIAETIEAMRRSIISTDNAKTEMGFHGFSEPRIQAMLDLAKWLPSELEALKMFARNVITTEDYDRIQAGHGMNTTDAKAFFDAELEPLNPRETIALNGRMAMKSQGWLPHSLGSDIPAEYKALYTPRLANPNIGTFDWAAHWKIPNIEWWFVAYFRGLVTKEDVTNAAKAENWPVEVIDKMFAVRQALIQEWMIPDILASGVMTDQEALDYMSYAGIDPKSADILIKWAHSKGNSVTAGKVQGLADKFEAQAKAMYEDGLINKEEYQLLLIEMGFNVEQATLMIGLADNEFDFSKRKNLANLMVKRVVAGQMTMQGMQSYLLGQGFTLKEVELYVDAANAAIQDKTRQPSTAEVGDFLKKDVLTFDEAVTAWRIDGWTDPWIEKLLLYYGGINVSISDATGTFATYTVTGLFSYQASQSQSATTTNAAGSGSAAG